MAQSSTQRPSPVRRSCRVCIFAHPPTPRPVVLWTDPANGTLMSTVEFGCIGAVAVPRPGFLLCRFGSIVSPATFINAFALQCSAPDQPWTSTSIGSSPTSLLVEVAASVDGGETWSPRRNGSLWTYDLLMYTSDHPAQVSIVPFSVFPVTQVQFTCASTWHFDRDALPSECTFATGSTSATYSADNQTVTCPTPQPYCESFSFTFGERIAFQLGSSIDAAQSDVTCDADGCTINAKDSAGVPVTNEAPRANCFLVDAWVNDSVHLTPAVSHSSGSLFTFTVAPPPGSMNVTVWYIGKMVSQKLYAANLGDTATTPARSCLQILNSWKVAPGQPFTPSISRTGYWLDVSGTPFQAYCDQDALGGGWTLFASKKSISFKARNTVDNYACATTTDGDCSSRIFSGLDYNEILWRFPPSSDDLHMLTFNKASNTNFREWLEGAGPTEYQSGVPVDGFVAWRPARDPPIDFFTITSLHYAEGGGTYISEVHQVTAGGSDIWVDLWSSTDTSGDSYIFKEDDSLRGNKCVVGYCRYAAVWVMAR